jgi:hypothetical protein
MSHDVKTWRRFDPESPPRLVGAGGTGAIVAILMSERARRTGWAPHVVRDLVRQWTRTGRRVVLADAAFESPRLHEAFGLSNTTGLSDVLLNRATIQDVARVVRGAGFYFIPAGAGSPDASGHVGRSRWADISRGMLEAGVTLAVVGHVEAAAGLWIAETVTDVVIVSTSDEPLELDEPLDGKIRAVVGLDEPVPFERPFPTLRRRTGSRREHGASPKKLRLRFSATRPLRRARRTRLSRALPARVPVGVQEWSSTWPGFCP